MGKPDVVTVTVEPGDALNVGSTTHDHDGGTHTHSPETPHAGEGVAHTHDQDAATAVPLGDLSDGPRP